MTDLISVESLIQSMISVPNLSTDTTDSESQLVRNVDEFLQYYLSQCEQIFKQPLYSLSKEEKIKALQFLDEKGVFKISKANILLCEAFKFSKFTLYNYLEEARKKKITID